MSLPLFNYPANWGCSIKTDAANCCHGQFCSRCSVFFPFQNICTCHRFCQTCCVAPARFGADKSPWAKSILIYINVAACTPWSAQVIRDLTAKLNALDPANGMNVLHGVLAVVDDKELITQFLELGVDPETKFIKPEAYPGDQAPKVAVPEELVFGTAVHFAAFHGRKDSLLAILEVGVDLDAKTRDGKTAGELAKTEEIRKILASAKSEGSKSLPRLAKEGVWHAIRHRMRSRVLSQRDMKETFEGKTVVEWVWKQMSEWRFAMKFQEDSLVAFKVMSEMAYRYNVEIPMGVPNVEADETGHLEGTGCSGTNQAFQDIQEAMLFGISSVKEELASLKTIVLDSMDK